MKLIFFLTAFFLVSIRVYFSWSGMERAKRGESEYNMVIKSNGNYEEMNYAGKIKLTEDESGFKSISSGGYFKFRNNDIKVSAVSNLKGEIEYTIYDGKSYLPLNDEGKKILAQAVREMILWGFDADIRMERIYHQGGVAAVLKEVDSLKPDQVKISYLNYLFTIDSLSPEFLPSIIKKAGALGSDGDKVKFLSKVSSEQLRNKQTDSAYFAIIEGLGSDIDKLNALQYFLENDSLNDSNTQRVMSVGESIGSDFDRATLFNKMIDRRLINGNLCDSLIEYITRIGSEPDQMNLYRKLFLYKSLSEMQWIKLQDKISEMGSDINKSNLLTELAENMPKTEALRVNYQKAAKTIGNDGDYGRAMRAIQ